MIRSASLLILALTLGGCCLSGNCYAPMAASGPGAMAAATPAAASTPLAAGADLPSANPDGLVTMSAEDGQEEYLPPQARKTAAAKPRKSASSRTDSDVSSSPRSRGEQAYEEQMAADRADDERLKRKLMICQNCSSKGSTDN